MDNSHALEQKNFLKSHKKALILGVLVLCGIVLLMGYLSQEYCSMEHYKTVAFPGVDDDPEYMEYINEHAKGCIDPGVLLPENFNYSCRLSKEKPRACQPIKVRLDGSPDEWTGRAPLIVDNIGDSAYKTIDLIGVYHGVDEQGNHYFMLDFGNTTLNPYCDECEVERKGDYDTGLLPRNIYNLIISFVPEGYTDGNNYARKIRIMFQWKAESVDRDAWQRLLLVKVKQKDPLQREEEAKTLYDGYTFYYVEPGTTGTRMDPKDAPAKINATESIVEVWIDKNIMPPSGKYYLHVYLGARTGEEPQDTLLEYAHSSILMDLSRY